MWAFMPISTTAELEVDSSITKAQLSRIGTLITGDIPADIRFRDPNSSKSMFSLPWEGIE